MASKSSIEWTDATWSPLRAQVKSDAGEIAKAKGYTSLVKIAGKMAGHVGQHCEHVSDGCKHCYSGTWQARCLPVNGTGLPFDRRSRDLIDSIIDEKALMLPLHWRAPKKIFVENQSDLFGEWITDEQIDRVFAVMAMCPQHSFQVLTKRPERMLEWASRDVMGVRLKTAWGRILGTGWGNGADRQWPLPKVWLGVSVENQATADARRDPLRLLAEAGWLTFVSYEPALEAVNWSGWEFLRWLICGGESGPGARPFDFKWARDTRDQCRGAGTAFFFKQAGSAPYSIADRISHRGNTLLRADGFWRHLNNRKGGDMEEFPLDLRIREFPAA